MHCLRYVRIPLLLGALFTTLTDAFATLPPSTAQQVTVPAPRYAQVLIYNTEKSVERRLLEGGYDIQDVTPEGNFVAYASDDDRARLNADGFSWVETIHDMAAYFVQRFHDTSIDLMQGYPTIQETLDSLNLYATDYPTLVAQPIVIGHSLENRNIYAIKMTHNPNDTTTIKPEVFYNSMIHPREVITHTQLLYFMRYLVNNYSTNARVQNILDNRILWFVPIVNPDGAAYNEQTNPNGGGMWRKNRRANTGGSYGVDLNRNFDSHWGYDNVGSSPQGSSDTYRGTAGFSEPETQVMRDFQYAHHFRVTIDYHSYSNDMIIPLSYRRTWAADHQLLSNMAHRFADPISYAVGNVWWVLYPANGDGTEWQYLNSPDSLKNFPLVIEIGSASDNFWPTQSRILPLCQQMLETNLEAAEFAGEPRIVLPPPIPRIESPDTVGISDYSPIGWVIDTPSTINPAVNFDFRATQSFPVGTETFDRPGGNNWNWMGSYVTIDTVHRVSGLHAAKFQYTNSVQAILKTRYPVTINPGDTLSYKIWYNIENNYDYFFAQISTDDGITWYSLAGNLTTTTNPNYDNWDNGVTGTSNSQFVVEKHPLTQYVGRSVMFRFLFWTDAGTYIPSGGVWIDDIYPSVLSPNPWTVVQDSLGDGIHFWPPAEGNWYMQVRARDAQGDTSSWSLPKSVTVYIDAVKENGSKLLPSKFALLKAYPNPFNPSTTIRYSLDKAATISLLVYNINGRKVATLTTGQQSSGEHQINWSGRDDFGVPVATGMYIVRLQSPTHTASMKVVLVK